MTKIIRTWSGYSGRFT